MHVPPEADARRGQAALDVIDEGAVGMAVGDEERSDLEGAAGPKVVNQVEDVSHLLVSEVRPVELRGLNLPVAEAAAADEGRRGVPPGPEQSVNADRRRADMIDAI